MARSDSTSLALALSDLKGSPVSNFAGEDLGAVRDLVLDLKTGSLRYVIVSMGGFLRKDEMFAVPWELFSVHQRDHKFVLDISKQFLKEAPRFQEVKWPDLNSAAWASEVHEYF